MPNVAMSVGLIPPALRQSAEALRAKAEGGSCKNNRASARLVRFVREVGMRNVAIVVGRDLDVY